MILHILTACSRPGNLPAWAADLAALRANFTPQMARYPAQYV